MDRVFGVPDGRLSISTKRENYKRRKRKIKSHRLDFLFLDPADVCLSGVVLSRNVLALVLLSILICQKKSKLNARVCDAPLPNADQFCWLAIIQRYLLFHYWIEPFDCVPSDLYLDWHFVTSTKPSKIRAPVKSVHKKRNFLRPDENSTFNNAKIIPRTQMGDVDESLKTKKARWSSVDEGLRKRVETFGNRISEPKFLDVISSLGPIAYFYYVIRLQCRL